MKSSRKICMILAAGLVGLGAMAAGPAVASTGAPVVMPSATSYAEAVDWLEENSGEQTRQSILATGALASESVHVEEYIGENGEVLAAVAVQKPARHQRALSWTSPGCTTTGACLTSSGRFLGYAGTGRLTGSWSGVTRIAAGNVATSLWSGAVVNYVVAHKAATYRTPIGGDTLLRN